MKKNLLFVATLFWLGNAAAQTNFIHQDSIFTRSSDCTLGISVCIDSIAYDDIRSLRFYLDGRQFDAAFVPCLVRTVHNYSYADIYRGTSGADERGPWQLESWIVDGQTYTSTFSNLNMLLDSMRRWNPSGQWQLEPVARIIYGYAAAGASYSCLSIFGTSRGGRSRVCYNQGVEYQGLRFRAPIGLHEFVVEKTTTGERDTVTLITACIAPDVIRRTVSVGANQTYCADLTQLLGSAVSTVNFCSRSTTHVRFDAPTAACIKFTGIAVGTDTACIRVCDRYGICDTTTLIVSAETPLSSTFPLRDTVTVGLSHTVSGVVFPNGTIASLTNICPTASGTNVQISLDTTRKTVTVSGVTVGIDTACIRICNTEGVCDTTILFAEALPVIIAPNAPTSFTFSDTISIGLPARPKVTFNSPNAPITVFENICPQNGGTNVRFVLDVATKSVSYQGLVVGVNTACIRICNALGQCDTTKMFITAIPLNSGDTSRTHFFLDTISVGNTRPKCTFTQPRGTITIFENICPQNGGTNVAFTVDTMTRCIFYRGVSVGVDTACIRICNDLGQCDTTKMFIQTIFDSTTVGGRRIHVFTDTITVGVSRTKCNLIAPISATRIRNICAGFSGTNVSFTTDNGTLCVDYRGVSIGIDTACIEICNAAGVCDTTYMYVGAITPNILRGRFLSDSITVKVGETKTYCADSSRVGQNFLRQVFGQSPRFSTINPISNGANPTACLSIRGFVVGRDTTQIVLVGNSINDTTRLFIKIIAADTVRKPTPSADTISLKIFETKTYCPDTSELRGSPISRILFCAARPYDNSTISLNNVTHCATVGGTSAGIDTFCLVICNTAGLCDTTTLFVKVSNEILRGRNLMDSITVKISETKTFCTDSSRVGTTFLRQIFGANPVNSVILPINNGTKPTACVTARGFTVGRDTIFIVLVGSNGVSDTTRLIVKVVPNDTFRLPTPSVDSIILKVFETKTYCPDQTELRGSPITLIKFCSIAPFDNTTIALDSTTKCAKIRGLSVGVDTFCLAICNQAGFCDTTTLYVRVRPDTVLPSSRIDTVRIFVGDSLTYCGIDTIEIRGAVDTIFNACPAILGKASFKFIGNCLKVKGLSVGMDSACVVVCNRRSLLCDTTRVIVLVTNRPVVVPKPSVDSIKVNVGATKNYCPDTSELRGANVTDIGFCSAANFRNAVISLDNTTHCATVGGSVVGKDTACLVICNATGVCDTTTLYVTVLPPDTSRSNSTVIVPVLVGKDTTICSIDTSQIRGKVDTIFDGCPGKNGTKALMEINKTTKCVKITGRNFGNDTLCVVVCNLTSGICDTTFVVAQVSSNQGQIIVVARPDFDSIQRGKTKIIEVYRNDTLSRRPTSLVVTQPKKGTADTISFGNGLIRYTAGRSPSSCGFDTFRYKVCIDAVCAEAIVTILVVCSDSLTVWNAISPNNDGKNDALVIEGLQNFPNHTVYIYNRWGNEVFKTKDYQNDWSGTWNGKDLPDGTYFYFIRNDDNGEILLTGYLQILR